MAARLERLVSLRVRLMDDLKEHIKVLNSFDEGTGSGTIRVRTKAANSAHQAFEQNWSQLESEPKYEHRSSAEQILINRTLSGAFYNAVGHAEDMLPTVNGSIANSTINEGHSGPSRHTTMKLPQLQLNKFDGNYDNWEEFRDTFLACFHNTKGVYSDCQKLLYLKGLLSEEPSLLLKNIKSTNENFALAWEILNKRYSNKRKIIYAHFKLLTQLPSVQKESVAELRSLLDTANASITAIRSHNNEIGLLDEYLVFNLSSKLDRESLRHWEEHLKASQTLPTFEQFKQFLEIRLTILENTFTFESSNNGANESKAVSNPVKNMAKNFHIDNKKIPKCTLCTSNHRPYECPQIKNVVVSERVQLVNARSLCTNCLYGHQVNDCKSKYRCAVCGQKHNTLLHMDTSVTQPCPTKNLVAHVTHTKQALLATARVLIQSHQGSKIALRALIDQGSSVNLLSESAAQVLRVKRDKCDISLITVGGSSSVHSQTKTSVTLNSIYNQFSIKFDAIIVPKITDICAINKSRPCAWEHIRGLQLADPDFLSEGTIDLLIGVELISQLLCDGLKIGPSNTPIAQNSHVGWIVSGTVDNESPKQAICCHISREQDSIEEINARIKQFWELEDRPSQKILSHDDQRCEDLFTSTTTIAPDGRYLVRLPFTIDPATPDFLGDSWPMAVKRLNAVERKLSRDPKLAEQVQAYFDAYINEGHLRPATVDEIADTANCYFMPHHAVLKESSTTTKVRVVFDASAKTSNGYSLNNRLMIGPPILNDLFQVIARWRTFPIAFTTDITKMYLQFWVHKDDAKFQRILLRVNGQITQYISQTVTFGTASAPFQAIRLLHLLASECSQEFPAVSELIRHNFYVDDCAAGAQNVQEATILYKHLTNVFATRGLKLRKWSSNSSEFLSAVPVDHQETTPHTELTNHTSAKALGLHWDRAKDSIQYTLQLPNRGNFATKRTLLSDFSMLFDPLGWLAPSLIIPRLLMQKVWMHGVDWDDALPDDINTLWQKVRLQLVNLSEISLPRWIGCSTSDKHHSLHCFCDASEKAYAAAIYLRIERDNGDVLSHLIAARSRVSPLKKVSIPRLELLASSLLHELYSKVKEMWPADIMVRAYSDSKIVLHWLSEHPSNWSCFIGNRTAKILDGLPSALWYHVPTKLNPADCASRGIFPEELSKHELWWHGPSFLLLSPEDWPSSQVKKLPENTEEKLLERKTKTLPCFVVHTDDKLPLLPLLKRFSSIQKLLRATAILRRFIDIKNWKKYKSTAISTQELDLSKEAWIRIIQSHYFPAEYKALSSNKPITHTSSLVSFTPFLKYGIMRVTGRLCNSLLPFNERHPIILPDKGFFTWLLIHDAHLNKTGHGGVQYTTQFLRQNYVIPHFRRTVKSQINKCIVCCRHRSKAAEQLMGNLPDYRVQPSSPFKHTGVDFAGPFLVKTSALRQATFVKCYVALFTCLVTRAIHLELVESLSTEAFLAALKRFVSRRGIPSDMYCDNGTNFIGAANELPLLLSKAQHSQTQHIIKSLAEDGIQWHCIPPRAPHFGGAWESQIKTIKFHLKRIIGEHKLRQEQFNTILAQIEAVVNSRPLCQFHTDTDGWQLLTPSHFLIGRALNAIPEPDLTQVRQNSLKAYKLSQQLFQIFWKVWSQEYLQQFLQRKKWTQTMPNLEVDQIVLLKEDNVPPGKWPLGRIISVITGDDENPANTREFFAFVQ